MGALRATGPRSAKIAIIQVSPEKTDIIEGKINSSGYGRFLKSALYEAGIQPSQCFYDFLTPYYPGHKGINSLEAQDSIRTYAPSLKKHLKSLPNLQVVILLGVECAVEFGITDGMKAIRGFIFDQLEGLPPAIVTYEPKYLFNGMMINEVVFLNDLSKAFKISEQGFKRPKENFNIEPTLRDVHNYVKRAVTKQERQYVDIEAIGHLTNRDNNECTLVGVGRKEDEHVLCIPYRTQGGGYYWSEEDEKKVRKLVKKLLTQCPCVFHNAEYDCKHLNYQGMGTVWIGGDTMLLHHALHPELRHSLDFVTSIYGSIPYWKDTLKKAQHQLDIPNEKFRRYNCLDVLAMIQIEDELIQENVDQGTYHIYTEYSIPMLNAALYFNDKGVPVNMDKLNTWQGQLKRTNAKLLKQIFEVWTIHPELNFDSGPQVSWLFYGLKPKTFDKKLEEYDSYELAGCRKRKDTKKYVELHEYIQIFQQTMPFVNLSGLTIKTTKTGASTDEEMRLRIKEVLVKRLDFLKHSIQKRLKQEFKGFDKIVMEEESEYTQAFVIEYKELEAMLIVIDNLMLYATNEKLLTTYTTLHIEPDGRVHGGYKIHGTKTGRLSSYSPNMQNIPPEAKKIFEAPKGWKFVQFDYTNLELVVLAYIAKIAYLMDIFERGLNVHDTNTETFLGITREDEHWDMWRRVIKMYVFGRNYGGSLRGMYRRMLVAIPGLRLTYKELEALDDTYFELQPEYGAWTEETLDELRRTRTLRNVFGRIRIFLGEMDKIVREGLNFKIQSTAADIMAKGIIRFMKLLKKYGEVKGLRLYPCMTVHDSLVLLVPDEEILISLKMLRKSMCAPMDINGTAVSFKGEVTISQSYKGKKEDEKTLEEWIEHYTKKSS